MTRGGLSPQPQPRFALRPGRREQEDWALATGELHPGTLLQPATPQGLTSSPC